MSKKILSLSMVVLFLTIVPIFGQFIKSDMVACVPANGAGYFDVSQDLTAGMAGDSAGFYETYEFTIPDDCRSDTLLWVFYQNSSDGNVDLDMACKRGWPVGGNAFIWEPDSIAIKTTNTTEGLTYWMIVAAAGDTLMNDGANAKTYGFVMPKAMRLIVKGGGSNNRDDNKFWSWLYAYKDESK
jgi:hypothetical protein